ncbi:S-adenosyl-L-methionine-dependent methyltransferase [Xylariaceae sp. FL0594]|nr:S-adenosyl-L-methionine-dependent methyltransferase [Xylariaceae sp. FL0594]
MDALLSQLKDLASEANAADRRRLMFALRELSNSLEETTDTIQRFGHSNLRSAAVKVGFDPGLFRLLDSKQTLSLNEFHDATGGDVVLLGRIMRYLAAIGVVDETDDGFVANHVTRILAEGAAESGISHCFETIAPQYQAIPRFLKKTGYKNPTDSKHTVLQEAFQTDLTAWEWLATQPEKLQYFNDFMALRRKTELSWLSVYPGREELGRSGWEALSADTARAVYVNIGGGIGHQCAEFKKKYPDVPGRVVLQDLGPSIAKAWSTPGVENMVHDFFNEQPVKGAKFYYMRAVLHNQPEKEARLLLERTRDAMTADSVLLIDEFVLPERGLDPYSATVDLTMMAATASMERTEAQWGALLKEVGLRLVKVYPYNPATPETVMDVRLSQAM